MIAAGIPALHPMLYLHKQVSYKVLTHAVVSGSFWLRSIERELQQKYFLLES